MQEGSRECRFELLLHLRDRALLRFGAGSGSLVNHALTQDHHVLTRLHAGSAEGDAAGRDTPVANVERHFDEVGIFKAARGLEARGGTA